MGSETSSRLEGNYLVTGANTGIGLETARTLAKRGAHVVMTARSYERGRPALEAIRAEGGSAELIALELASFDDIYRAAGELIRSDKPIHALINNAGLAGTPGLTNEGFELTFGVNHLGTFLFTMLLLPRLIESGPSRVVTVASRAHYAAKELDFAKLRAPSPLTKVVEAYNVSKLANVLFTRELARRLEGTKVTAYSLHPGVVSTDVWRAVPWPVRSVMRAFMLSPKEGAKTTLHCATAPLSELGSGLYYDESKPKEPSALALDDALAAELWRRSIEWTGAADFPG